MNDRNNRTITVSSFFMLFILCASTNLTEAEAIELTAKEIFVKSPGKGITAHANSYYTHRRGLMKMKLISTITRSDTADTLHRSFSLDNGCTWSKTEPVEFIFKTQKGTKRQYARSGFVDPTNGYLITMVNEGVLPTDNPLCSQVCQAQKFNSIGSILYPGSHRNFFTNFQAVGPLNCAITTPIPRVGHLCPGLTTGYRFRPNQNKFHT